MDKTLQDRLAELVARMLADTAPPPPPASTDPAACEQVRRHLFELRDALDSLRVGVTYLSFDLEATKRENVSLRRELDERRPR
ncbi:MAG: hypothetical protein U0574_07165 [Phycisphaerales bacterium]